VGVAVIGGAVAAAVILRKKRCRAEVDA